MLTLLHAADFHLDSPFRALPAREAALRRQSQRETLDRLRDLALEERADLCLLAGDLFDSAQVYPETLERLARTLGQFPCPVCIAPGNHDYWSDQSPYAAQPWPDNVHIFRREGVAALPFPDLGVRVWGCAFTGPSREDDPLAGFSAPPGDGLVNLGVFHGQVGDRGSYAPISPGSLARSGLTYAALGHVHAFSGLQRAGDVCWAYPGCPQGRGFDELGDKGALVVTVEPGGQVAARFRPLPGPRYWDLRLSVTGLDPAAALSAALGRTYQGDYLRLTLTGEAERLELPALRAVGAELCRVFLLRDDTTLPRDVWARAGEDTLTGLFLQELRHRLDAADEAERPVLQAALRWGLAALEGREAPL